MAVPVKGLKPMTLMESVKGLCVQRTSFVVHRACWSAQINLH